MEAHRSAAAAVAAFVFGGAGGWFAHSGFERVTGTSPNGFEAFTADAVEAYRLYVVEVRHPVSKMPAADAEHLVQWLSKRVTAINWKHLIWKKVGLKLVGGRLLLRPTGAAAFAMYSENASAGEALRRFIQAARIHRQLRCATPTTVLRKRFTG